MLRDFDLLDHLSEGGSIAGTILAHYSNLLRSFGLYDYTQINTHSIKLVTVYESVMKSNSGGLKRIIQPTLTMLPLLLRARARVAKGEWSVSREIYSGWGLSSNDPYLRHLANVYLLQPQVLGFSQPAVLAASTGGSVLYPS